MEAPTRVLVVDDEPALLTMLDVALRSAGYAVTLAHTGAEAVAVYAAHYADIRVVLLDVRMPGMDGPATLTALRAINPGLRCCFMTGYAGKYAAADLLDFGAQYILEKPFPLSELFRAIKRLTE